jgi:hypothetical protein
MARGFESKSVSERQDELERERDRAPGAERPSPRRRSLELARVDLQRRLERAPEPHREPLRLALKAIEDELARS